mmetsp:Transcript_47503/g.120344  ORF Transcript_47503/g.120344 Transcript_47503/m.120344 type:complete len:388 (+) Transcript_47503:72-1235(+)
MMQFLGASVAAAAKHTNENVASENNYHRVAPVSGGDGEVHVLMFALDYKKTSNPLTCTMDAKNMKTLCAACGIADVTIMLDEQCTKENVLRAIAEVGGRCDKDDYFVIYYSGHGTSCKDEDGDEDDGKDEAFCFVMADGSITEDSLLTDDEFAAAVTEATEDTVRCLILTDCCHSGTIADLDADCWQGREAISITGCLDSQTSGDMGKGGIFTHSMLLAIDKLDNHGRVEYSVGDLYKATVKEDDAVFGSKQVITINASRDGHPGEMPWPLLPVEYAAPLNAAVGKITGGGGGGGGGSGGGGGGGTDLSDGSSLQQIIQGLLANPDVLHEFNISPAIVTAMVTGAKHLLAGFAQKKLGCNQKDAEKLLDGAEKLMRMGAGLLGRWRK